MRDADQPPQGRPGDSAESFTEEQEALLPELSAWASPARGGYVVASLATLSLALGVVLWALAAMAAASPARWSEAPDKRTLQQGEGELPECLGQPSEQQLLQGELLRAICSHLGKDTRFLVFGNGYDSPMWLHSNPRGVVQFLEHHQHWIDIQPQEVQDVSVLVNYTCSLDTAEQEVNDTDMLREFYDAQLPGGVRDQQWDVILVDSPEGFGSDSPGRGQSIYAASLLAKHGAHVYVNDCGRPVEELYVSRWFEQQGWQKIVHDDNGNGGQACLLVMNETQKALSELRQQGAGAGTLGHAATTALPGHGSAKAALEGVIVTTPEPDRATATAAKGLPALEAPLPEQVPPAAVADIGAGVDEMGNVPMGGMPGTVTPKPEESGFKIFGINFT